MPKINKYTYLLVIQQCYAGYWEDCSEYNRNDPTELKCYWHDVREYRLLGYPTRTINRRELNSD